MIWTAPVSEDPDRAAMELHLTRHLATAYPNAKDVPDCLPAVAAAIADVWVHDLARSPLPDDFLPLLASRALWGIGEQDAARGLLKDSTHLGGLVERGGPSLSACAHLATRVMRPVESSMVDAGPAWALDVARLGSISMELALFQRVRAVLEQVAEVWDKGFGRGVLLLRGPVDAPGLAAYIEEVLGRIAIQRGWKATPEIVRAALG